MAEVEECLPSKSQYCLKKRDQKIAEDKEGNYVTI
jgi:hypothetical protein